MEQLKNKIEAIIFVSGNPISAKDIAEKMDTTEKVVMQCARELQQKYEKNGGIHLLIYNNKLQFCSNPDFSEDITKVLNPIRERELSRSMLEVAAIVAYKQPVTRLEIENIRGFNSEYAVQMLLKHGIIEITGKRNVIGHPSEFGTTDEFLKKFQIESLSQLPDFENMMEQIAKTENDTYLYKKDTYVPEDESLALDETATTEINDNLDEN